jgi:transcriptional regulator of heat shock response
VKKIFFMACNGEYDNYNDMVSERAIPYYLSINIVEPNGKELGVNVFFTKSESYYVENVLKGNNVLPIDFDLNDINKIFKNINQKAQVDFIIKVAPESKKVDIEVTQDGKLYDANDFISKIY